MRLSKFVNKVILWTMIIAFIFLVITSIIVRDYDFIIKHPYDFIWELLFFSVVPSLIFVFIFVKTRNIKIKKTIPWFLVMVIKFAIFHLLFQLSGVYTVVFENFV
jgi:hypothetical protein